MAALFDILAFLNRELEIPAYDDSSLNGLQVEGRPEVRKLAVAVDSGLAVIQEAARRNVDALLVHHGMFWKDVLPVSGPRKAALQTLLDAEMSLIAVHLPLDGHMQWGNNALLAKMLGLSELAGAAKYLNRHVGVVGRNALGLTRKQMSEKLATLQGCRTPFIELEFGPEKPQRVCIVSGAGADELYKFASDGFDTLISGEPRQFAYHFCKENKLNALFPGHYATETVGVQRVGRELEAAFGITWEFIDEPTGI